MGGLRQYSIPFRGLKEGKHEFHYEIDEAFFDQFESSEISRGELISRIEMDKHSQFLELRFYISGIVEVTCDRCLEEFPLEIQHQAKLYIRFGEETLEQTDEVQILADSVNELRLEQYFYEYIHLALPYQKFHPVKDGMRGCNPEMKKVLDSLSSDDSKNKVIDPRWDKLKEI